MCVLCAVCLGGMYRQFFCSGLAMVIAVNVGDIWELPRLPLHALAHTWNLPRCGVGWGVNPGRSGSSRSFFHSLGAAGVFGGGVAGAEPPHKGGPNRPDRP